MEKIKFKDLPNNSFFIYQGDKLCKFGTIGMGVNKNGVIAKEINGDEIVEKSNL